MAIAFAKATKKQAKLRLALIGPAGCGKTYTALTIATGIGGAIGLIDTEHGSASKYGDIFDFITCPLTSFSPENYIEAIHVAESSGVDVLCIDGLSHAWSGKDGILEFVDKAAKRSSSGNSFGAWRDATPKHNALVEAILAAKMHVICTLRAKMEYVLEKDERTGKQVPRKVGLQPIQRDGLEYEFDVVGDMTLDHDLLVTKTRAPFLAGQTIAKPGKSFGNELREWLTDGAPAETDTTQEFDIKGKRVVTKGITKETLLAVWDASRALDKATKSTGEAKNLLQAETDKGSTVDLTQAEGEAFLKKLQETLAEVEQAEAKAKAEDGSGVEGQAGANAS